LPALLYIFRQATGRHARASFRWLRSTTSQTRRLSSAPFLLITGGERYLRRDFADIYWLSREKGCSLCIHNACLVNEEHVRYSEIPTPAPTSK